MIDVALGGLADEIKALALAQAIEHVVPSALDIDKGIRRLRIVNLAEDGQPQILFNAPPRQVGRHLFVQRPIRGPAIDHPLHIDAIKAAIQPGGNLLCACRRVCK